MSALDVIRRRVRWTLVAGEALALLSTLPSRCVDIVVTDPPYSSGGQFRGDRVQDTTTKYVCSTAKIVRPDFAGDNRDQRAYRYWCALWMSECLRVSKPGAPLCVFTDWRQLPTTVDAVQAGGWVWRGIVPWDKTERCRPSKGRFAAQCEYIVWASNGPLPAERGVGCLRGVVRAMVRREHKRLHIAGKPPEVLEHAVAICKPGGIVLDPFAGSATTGLAALRTGRRFIGCELDEACRRLGLERLDAETRRRARPVRAA